jgi:hypothetical protein
MDNTWIFIVILALAIGLVVIMSKPDSPAKILISVIEMIIASGVN